MEAFTNAETFTFLSLAGSIPESAHLELQNDPKVKLLSLFNNLNHIHYYTRHNLWQKKASMRGDCVICDRGAEFLPRTSARRCLTFPHGFIGLPGFPLGVVLSDPIEIDFPPCYISSRASWTATSYLHAHTAPLHCWLQIFHWTLQYFGTTGPATSFPHSCFVFIRFQAGWVGSFRWTMQCFNTTEKILHLGLERDSLAWELGLITSRLAETAQIFVCQNVNVHNWSMAKCINGISDIWRSQIVPW